MNALEQREARRSVQRALADQRLEEQRQGFATIAQAVEKSGHWKAAREIRRESDAAIARMQEITDEHDALIREIDQLKDENARLTALLPTFESHT